MNIKNKVICFGLMVILSITLAGCGFNENKAKADSRQQLESFLKLYNNKQVIVKGNGDSIDKEKVKKYINNNFENYFTKDFINNTDNQIETGSLQDGKTFYIREYNSSSVIYRNNYLIDSPVVNKNDKTVEYKLKGNDGFAEYAVDIIMKQEDGKWKIDKAS